MGGQPLTAKTICGLLRDDFDADFVERAIEEINLRYSRQNRPYEIRPGEGGYRIVLRGEFEPLRNRVYGFGPKQVRLSQETLEILALVAYRQPIGRKKIEEIAKRSAGIGTPAARGAGADSSRTPGRNACQRGALSHFPAVLAAVRRCATR